MKSAEAVVFDYNGTLYFDYRENRDAWNAISQKYRGHSFSDTEYDSMMGMTDYMCVKRILGDDTPLHTLDEVSKEKEIIYLTLCEKRNLKIESEAREFIHRLKKDNIKVLIASSAPKMNMDWYYENAGIKDLFRKEDITAGREDIPSKPAPDIFRLALERAHTSPDRAVCFEDSPNGLRAALATPFKKVYGIESPGFDDSEQRRLAKMIDWSYTLTHYEEVISL